VGKTDGKGRGNISINKKFSINKKKIRLPLPLPPPALAKLFNWCKDFLGEMSFNFGVS